MERMFDEAILGFLDLLEATQYRPEIRDLEEFLLIELEADEAGNIARSLNDPLAGIPSCFTGHPLEGPDATQHRLDLLLDLMELLHNKIVSLPLYRDDRSFGDFDREAGMSHFRTLVNPVLALGVPAFELLPNGQAVPRDEERRDMYIKALPEDAPPVVIAAVDQAKKLYLRRGASAADKKAAVTRLVGALEHERSSVKAELLRKDEGALFELANGFGIRHENRKQRVDYDNEVWLDWMFHVYLATIQATTAVKAKRESAG